MTTEESTIDTSRMAAGERAALEATEAARESATMERTFAGGLFLGRLDLERIMPFPEQTTEDRDQGDAFLQRLEKFCATSIVTSLRIFAFTLNVALERFQLIALGLY